MWFVRRLFARITVCLGFGSIMSLLAGWACTLWIETGIDRTEIPIARATVIMAGYLNDERADMANIVSQKRRQPGEVRTIITITASRRRSATLHAYRQGWPFHVASGEYVFGEAAADPGMRWAFRLPRAVVGEETILAFRPIPLAMFASAALYGAPLWLLVFGPGEARRAIRRRRGRCPDCGYDLRGEYDGGCAECGWNRGRSSDAARANPGEA